MVSVVSNWQKAHNLNKQKYWYLKLEVTPLPGVFCFPAVTFLLREEEREESTFHAREINTFIWFLFQSSQFGRTGEIFKGGLN